MTSPNVEPTVSRRVLAKGAAWAAPAAAVVAMAPAVAASPGALSITSSNVAGCTYSVKWQGKAGKSYKVEYLSASNVVLHTTSPITGAGTDSWTSNAGPVAKVVVTILSETPVLSDSATYSVPPNPALTLVSTSGNTRNWTWTGPSGTYTFYHKKKNDSSYTSISSVVTPYQSTVALDSAYVGVVVCGLELKSDVVTTA